MSSSSSRSNRPSGEGAKDGSDHHESTRHRIARIAGQLGAGLTNRSQRSSSSSSTSSSSSSSSASSSASAVSVPNDRLLSISRQLGGAVTSPFASRQALRTGSGPILNPSGGWTVGSGSVMNSHLTPHEEAKQWERLPRYKELPKEGGFPGCAWEVWGKGDQLGTLNLLTDAARAKAAREEIRTGHCVSLTWPMHLPIDPAFGRKAATHTPWGKGGDFYTSHRRAVLHERRVAGEAVEDRSDGDEKAAVSDDEIHINTQSGSQWDGFSHFGHLSLDCFYQGHTRKAIHQSFERGLDRPIDPRGEAGPPLGIQAWAQKGICGRGVLLDVWGWLLRNNDGNAPYDPARSHAISLADVQACARAQGVHFRKGDILLIRTGWTLRYYHSTPEERRENSTGKKGFVGLEQGEDVLEWLWDHHFAAVASDCPAFERWPAPMGTPHLHETLLAMWGCPIGEMFDLEKLTEQCQTHRRWTFYFSSWPLNVFGGVASTANAGATF